MSQSERDVTQTETPSLVRNLSTGYDSPVSLNNEVADVETTKPSSAASTPGLFGSLLFEQSCDAEHIEDQNSESFVSDLNLDIIVSAIVAGQRDPGFVAKHFYNQLHDIQEVYSRQEIFRDLEDQTLLKALKDFAQNILQVDIHAQQIEKMQNHYQKEGWFLDEVAIYCEAISVLSARLNSCNLRSKRLNAFRNYLSDYVSSDEVVCLNIETNNLKKILADIKYSIRIKGLKVEVRRYEGESDYSAEVDKTFERFKQGAVKDYQIFYPGRPGINHVGTRILELLARLFSTEFCALDDYCLRHVGFFDENIRRFERELRFYVAYIEYISPIRLAGLRFCYPEVSQESKEIFANDTFDLALANKLVSTRTPVISNDFYLKGLERVLVISGPNQGGKTTFARTFGQLHHFASIGCPVPGTSARLFLFDKIYTHFEQEEDPANMNGKLEDDLVRIHDVFEKATTNSIIIMNEIFTSTTLNDARCLGTKIMERVIELDLLCVYVTFIDEIASLGETIVSMKSTIVPENPSERTYKVVRGPADGLAYALAIAEKYHLTYDLMRKRIIS